ncbi:MAG: replicative DNA helicase [archaeon]|nr:replicative DNA helicase [archaeon]
MLNKIQPQNLEAEESVIASCILFKDDLEKICDLLKPEDFYKTSHQLIYESILSLKNKNENIDIITVVENLRGKNNLEKIGGPSYIAFITDSIPVSSEINYHAKIIKEKSFLRRLINFSVETMNKCYDPSTKAQDIYFNTQKEIGQLELNSFKKKKNLTEMVNETIDEIQENSNKEGDFIGLRTGLAKLDEQISGLQPTFLYIIAARPGMGKTALAINNIADTVSLTTPTLIFSIEMSSTDLIKRLISKKSRLNNKILNSTDINKKNWDDIHNASEMITEQKLFIEDKAGININDIKIISREYHKKNNIGCIIIDYLQLIQSANPRNQRRLEVEEISRQLKILAKELKIPVVALSQLSRLVEQRPDKIPILSDLRESGSIEQDADVVIFIYRPEVYTLGERVNEADIIIPKQRAGQTGFIKCHYVKHTTTFTD